MIRCHCGVATDDLDTFMAHFCPTRPVRRGRPAQLSEDEKAEAELIKAGSAIEQRTGRALIKAGGC